jgi:hypothetical protein
LRRKLKLFITAVVAIDGSKFKAINNRDKNFTVTKMVKRLGHDIGEIAPGSCWANIIKGRQAQRSGKRGLRTSQRRGPNILCYAYRQRLGLTFHLTCQPGHAASPSVYFFIVGGSAT